MELATLRFVIIAPEAEVVKWTAAFAAIAPEVTLEVGPEVPQPEAVSVLLLWNHPQGSLRPFTQARLIYSLGAGVDHLMRDPHLPKQIPICRIVDPLLSFSMSNYILFALLHYHRQWDKYTADQQRKIWDHDAPPERSVKVGILGLGTLGQDAAQKIHALGFEVVGYSPSPKKLPGITTFHQGELDEFLARCNVLVCTVPYTPKTHGLLSMSLFKKLTSPTFLINASRGKVQKSTDILEALDQGILTGAFLDVFEEEPLPQTSPFWSHPKVYITPHVASITNPQAGVRQMLKNLCALTDQKPLEHLVNLEKGY